MTTYMGELQLSVMQILKGEVQSVGVWRCNTLYDGEYYAKCCEGSHKEG